MRWATFGKSCFPNVASVETSCHHRLASDAGDYDSKIQFLAACANLASTNRPWCQNRNCTANRQTCFASMRCARAWLRNNQEASKERLCCAKLPLFCRLMNLINPLLVAVRAGGRTYPVAWLHPLAMWSLPLWRFPSDLGNIGLAVGKVGNFLHAEKCTSVD